MMRSFMTEVWSKFGGENGEAGLLEALKSGQLESSVFPKLSKDYGWPSLPGGSQENVHTAGATKRYEEALQKYQSAPPTTPPSATTNPSTQLGQNITNNYGLNVGQERQFTHPQYGILKAHKTRTGFDFYKGMKKLDMSPNKPQAQSIVDYFTSTNGGQNISPPPSAQADKNNQISSLSIPSDKQTSGGGITVLNTNGQQVASAGSVSPPSGDMGVESGRSPTQDFYNSPFSIGIS
jgi:hypothetical protein